MTKKKLFLLTYGRSSWPIYLKMKQQINIIPITKLYHLRQWKQYNVVHEDNELIHLTATANPRIHSKGSALATLSYQCKDNIIDYIVNVLCPDTLVYSIEYQKNGYSHLHCMMQYDEPTDRPTAEMRYDITRAIARKFGDTQCNPVDHPQEFLEYLYKEVEKNDLAKSFQHNYIWTKK